MTETSGALSVKKMQKAPAFKSFSEFYPFYQEQHKKRGTRMMHVLGTTGFLALAGAAGATRQAKFLPLGVLVGYGCAWIGHFFMEKNRPATFTYPLWSLMGDFKMLFNIFTFREPLNFEPSAWKPAAEEKVASE
mmetsp:Transcript_20291/g.56537  ORF Transcript_20291/g.56537 Transcript_20291/m.56537 type:complete len:134 (+) Transcript_20291:30-431(+)